MAFFRDRTVNLLNLHYGMYAIALSGGGSFFVVYLVEAGLSASLALASLALILAGRFVIRPIVVPLAVRARALWSLPVRACQRCNIPCLPKCTA